MFESFFGKTKYWVLFFKNKSCMSVAVRGRVGEFDSKKLIIKKNTLTPRCTQIWKYVLTLMYAMKPFHFPPKWNTSGPSLAKCRQKILKWAWGDTKTIRNCFCFGQEKMCEVGSYHTKKKKIRLRKQTKCILFFKNVRNFWSIAPAAC